MNTSQAGAQESNRRPQIDYDSPSGDGNTANGDSALDRNVSRNYNTAEGSRALDNSTGSNNTALGANAGI